MKYSNTIRFIFSVAMAMGLSTFANAQGSKKKSYSASPAPIAAPKYESPSNSGAITYGSSHNAFSSLDNWEFTTRATQGFLTSGKSCKDCSSQTLFGASVGAHYLLQDQIQVGAEVALAQVARGTGTTSTFDLMGVFTYNLDHRIEDSILFRGGLGLLSGLKSDGSDYESKFSFFFGVGKRFNLNNHISYLPELRIVKKGDIDFAIDINYLNFAMKF